MKISELRKLIREEIIKIFEEDEIEYGFDTAEEISNSSFLFTVPNNTSGLEKIKRVKKNLSDIFDIKVVGRNTNKEDKLGTKYDKNEKPIPMDEAKYLSVYVYPKK